MVLAKNEDLHLYRGGNFLSSIPFLETEDLSTTTSYLNLDTQFFVILRCNGQACSSNGI